MNIQKMMQQAQEMQTKLQEMQEKIGDVEVIGTSGGGMVKVTMTCKGFVKTIDVDESVFSPEEKEVTEDLIVAACNDARQKADDTMAEKTKEMMEELGLPAGVQLPF